MKRIRVQDLHRIVDEERPPKKKDENHKKRGRVYTEENPFPTKKPDSWIGKNIRERNRH